MAPLPTRSAWALLLAGLCLAGCGRTMTEDDCRRVGESLQQAWRDEVQKANPDGGKGQGQGQGQASAKAAGVVRSEEERLVSDWAAECKRDLVGKRVDEKELACLLGAKSLEQIGKCSER